MTVGVFPANSKNDWGRDEINARSCGKLGGQCEGISLRTERAVTPSGGRSGARRRPRVCHRKRCRSFLSRNRRRPSTTRVPTDLRQCWLPFDGAYVVLQSRAGHHVDVRPQAVRLVHRSVVHVNLMFSIRTYISRYRRVSPRGRPVSVVTALLK